MEGLEQTIADEVLMREFQETLDEQVFRILASRYYDRALGAACQRTGNESAAQDAVQETLLRVVRHRRRYDPAKPFAPWFFALLRNVCTDLCRSEQRRRRALDEFRSLHPADGVEGLAKDRVLDLTLELAPAESELLRLRFSDGLSLGEIARALDCSLEAAKKRLQRVLKRLRP